MLASRLLKETPHFAAAELGSAMVVCWKQSATIAALRELEAPTKMMATRHPDGFAWVVITGDVGNPEETDFTKESSAQLQRFKGCVKAVGCVQPGKTIAGTLITVAFRVAHAFSLGVTPVGIYKTTGETCLWLHGLMVKQGIAGQMTFDDLYRGTQELVTKYVPAGSK